MLAESHDLTCCLETCRVGFIVDQHQIPQLQFLEVSLFLVVELEKVRVFNEFLIGPDAFQVELLVLYGFHVSFIILYDGHDILEYFERSVDDLASHIPREVEVRRIEEALEFNE